MEKKNCRCKNGGKGHNFIPDRITVTGEGGKEISNRDLVCHHCAYKKRGDTSSCLKYAEKTKEVLAGGNCEGFLGELGSKSHGCGDCGDCGNCGGECDGCGDCGGCQN